MRLLLFLLALSFILSEQVVRYDGHQVFRIFPAENTHDLQLLKQIRELNVDFWTDTIVSTKPVDVRVPPALISTFVAILKQFHVKFEVMIENVQQLIDEQNKKHMTTAPLSSLLDETFYETYHTYDEIVSWTQQLVAAYPNLTRLIDVGKSYEGRSQYAVRISTNFSSSTKPTLWFDGGLHAREWIATATVTYMLGHIVSGYGTDSDLTNLVNEFDLYVMPVLNPDGYIYSWEEDRMWRKNRRINSGTKCVGVDLNRNWDYHWGDSTEFSDTFPCSEAYRGPSAFSEVEISNVANFLASISNFEGYINFHSYSQLWMFPWAYTTTPTPDSSRFEDQGNKVCKAIAQSYGTVYESGQIATIIYIAYGSSSDWIYGTLNTTYAIGVELRDTGEYGFILPDDQIVPSGIETLDGFLAFAQDIAENRRK